MSTSNTATASAVAQNHELSHCCICGDALGSNRISNNHTRLQKKLSRKRNTKPITRKDYTLPCSKTECVEMYFQQPVEKQRTSIAEACKRYIMAQLAGAGVRVSATVDNDPDGDLFAFDYKRFIESKGFTQGDPELPKQRGIPAARVFFDKRSGHFTAAAYSAAEVLIEQLADFRENLERVDRGCPDEDPNNPRYGWKSARVRASGVQTRAEERWRKICAGDQSALAEWLA